MKLAKYQMDQLLDSFSIKWTHIRPSTDPHERRPKTYHLRTAWKPTNYRVYMVGFHKSHWIFSSILWLQLVNILPVFFAAIIFLHFSRYLDYVEHISFFFEILKFLLLWLTISQVNLTHTDRQQICSCFSSLCWFTLVLFFTSFLVSLFRNEFISWPMNTIISKSL